MNIVPVILVHYYIALATSGQFTLSRKRPIRSDSNKNHTELSENVTTDNIISGVTEIGHESFIETKRSHVENCCIRLENYVSIGIQELEDEVLDVGKCQKSCHKIYQNVLQDIKELNINNITEAEELLHNIHNKDACGPVGMCVPSLQRIERRYTSQGLREISVIEDCKCELINSPCRRKEEVIRYFPGTPFETIVDIGSCSGQCSQDLYCQPTRNITKHLKGPNGSYGISVTSSCGCLGSCYRLDKFELVYDHSTLNNSGTKTELSINVGACIGICSMESFHCVLRDPREPSHCLMSLKRTNKCNPTGYTKHKYINKDGQENLLMSIQECQCS